MGANKALLEVCGTGILQRTAGLLRPLAAEVFVVADDAAPYAAAGLPVVPDLLPGLGALGGIHAALARSATPFVLCVACDLPLLSEALLRLICGAAAPGVDAVLPQLPTGPEPLVAVYGRTLLPQIERLLAAGRLRVVGALEGARVRHLSAAEIDAVDPGRRSFVNVNTPAELAAARALAGDRGR
jgi:molybdopterin-guanine dinucleotide biosynthesis protein A